MRRCEFAVDPYNGTWSAASISRIAKYAAKGFDVSVPGVRSAFLGNSNTQPKRGLAGLFYLCHHLEGKLREDDPTLEDRHRDRVSHLLRRLRSKKSDYEPDELKAGGRFVHAVRTVLQKWSERLYQSVFGGGAPPEGSKGATEGGQQEGGSKEGGSRGGAPLQLLWHRFDNRSRCFRPEDPRIWGVHGDRIGFEIVASEALGLGDFFGAGKESATSSDVATALLADQAQTIWWRWPRVRKSFSALEDRLRREFVEASSGVGGTHEAAAAAAAAALRRGYVAGTAKAAGGLRIAVGWWPGRWPEVKRVLDATSREGVLPSATLEAIADGLTTRESAAAVLIDECLALQRGLRLRGPSATEASAVTLVGRTRLWLCGLRIPDPRAQLELVETDTDRHARVRAAAIAACLAEGPDAGAASVAKLLGKNF